MFLHRTTIFWTEAACCAQGRFLARFDGALIDGQSWGRGRTTLSRSPPIDTDPHSNYHAMIAQLHQKEVSLLTFNGT